MVTNTEKCRRCELLDCSDLACTKIVRKKVLPNCKAYVNGIGDTHCGCLHLRLTNNLININNCPYFMEKKEDATHGT